MRGCPKQEPRVAQLFLALLVTGLLQRQRLVEHEPTGARETAHKAPLLTVGPEFVFEGLQAFHPVHQPLFVYTVL